MTASPTGYLPVTLVSDQAGAALVQDPHLKNAWGVAISPNGGEVWVADNATNVATLYQGAVNTSTFSQYPVVVNVPGTPNGAPTGVVFNPTADFSVSSGGSSGAAMFLFASQNGQISGWNTSVPAPTGTNPGWSTQAEVGASVPGAEFTGLAIVPPTTTGATSTLYAADFHNGKIDAFDGTFAPKTLAANAFTDPNLTPGYAPYNIQLIGQQLYVTYAPQDATQTNPVVGGGHGIIDIYNTDGTFNKRFAASDQLNDPWGVVLAPSGFGDFTGDILVANSGDGRILAYDTNGNFQGALNDGPGSSTPIIINGVRGLAFGNSGTTGAATELFYSAAPGGQHGLFGQIINAFQLPLAIVPTTVTATENHSFTGTLATFTSSNPQLTAGQFRALINWGDNAQTNGSVTSNGNNGFIVSGSHTYTEDSLNEPIKVTIIDPSNNQVSATATAVVAEADFTASPASMTATEGQTLSGVVGTFSDPDAGSDASHFTATINWGDNTNSSGGSVTSAGTGGFSVTGSHTYADEGTFTVTTVISENDGATATPTGTITSTVIVADADSFTGTAVPISATEGSTFSGNVATFTDSNIATAAGDLSATIDWGDGSSTTLASVSGSAGSFTVSGSHVFADEGTITPITVTLAEKSPGTASASVTTTATVADSDSFTGTPATVAATQGTTLSAVTVATFSDSNTSTAAGDLSATIDWGDGTTSDAGSVSGSAGSFTVTGSHTYATNGKFPVHVTIAESTPGTATGTVTGSEAIVFDSDFTGSGATMPQSTEGTALPTTTSVGTFADPDGSASASDYAASIDWGDGTTTTGSISADGSGGFSVTGGHLYADEGNFTIDVEVFESGATPVLSGTFTTTATVADADVGLAGTGNTTLTATERQSVSGTLATFTDPNVNAVAGDFTATIDWGDGTSAETVSATGSGGAFTISGSHTYADEGTFSPVVTLADPGGATASATASIAVSEADTLTAGAAMTIAASERSSFSGTVATFTDSDTSATASDLTATILWGDGTSTTLASVSGSAGSFTVTGNHTYADDGSYAASVVLSDPSPGTASTTATFTANIAEVDLTGTVASIAASEGTAFTGTVATFTDPGSTDNGSAFSATIDWGDGNSSGGIVSNNAGTLVVTGTHTYGDEGTFSVVVRLTESAVVPAAVATATGTATVADTDALTITGISVTATEAQTFTGNVATFTDTNTSSPAGNFSAMIQWGDGTSSSGNISGSAGHFTVHGSHVYQDEGSFSAKVSVQDNSPGTASATATIAAAVAEGDVLTGTAASIAPTSGTAFAGTVATFTDTNQLAAASDFAATIDWGDGTSTTGTVTGTGGTFTVAGSHTYAAAGANAIKVTLSDDAPGTAKATATATATVSASSISAVGVPINVPQGTDVTNAQVATFTATGGGGASAYTATIDWGDGKTSAGTITASGNGFSITGSHSYYSPDTRTVKVSIQGPGGSTTQAVTTATVGSDNARFIAQVYRDLLHREAEPQGEQFWTSLIDGGHGRAEETLNIEHSQEFRTDTIQGLYLRYLHRQADLSAFNATNTLLIGGGTPEQISETIAASPEYFQARGGGTSQGYLSALYSDALGRPVDAATLASLGSKDFSSQATRDQIVQAVFGGEEYFSHLVNDPGATLDSASQYQWVVGWYQAYLHRDADSASLANDVAKLKSGTPDDAIVSGIIGSDEYFTRLGQSA